MHKRFKRLLPKPGALLRHRWLRPLWPHLHHPSLWRASRRGLAMGMALGLFFGFLVPVGQIPVAAAASILMRANLPMAVASTFVTNPVTVAPIYYGAYRLGQAMLGTPDRHVAAPAPLELASLSHGLDIVKPLMIGLLTLATLGAGLGFAGASLLWTLMIRGARWQRSRRLQRLPVRGVVTIAPCPPPTDIDPQRASTRSRPMGFAHDYLQQLERVHGVLSLPRVRALHLPPVPTPDAMNRGEFCALELEDGSMGLSYVLFDDMLERLRAGPGDALRGSDPMELARRYPSGDGGPRTLGFAAANAITQHLYRRAGFTPNASADSIGQLNPQASDRIGMIGLFGPLVKRIVASGASLTVVELNPALAGTHEGYRVTLDASDLQGCNKVLSTSTLLLNDSLDRMLGHCAQASWFAMVGPSAGCLPDALFARGVTMVGGSWVHDGPGFAEALRCGASRSDCAVKYALTPAQYPGFEALLNAARSSGSPP